MNLALLGGGDWLGTPGIYEREKWNDRQKKWNDKRGNWGTRRHGRWGHVVKSRFYDSNPTIRSESHD